MRLPEVAGRLMLMTHDDFERGCKLTLLEEQEKISLDNHLVNLLCEAIRLNRECVDHATSNLHGENESRWMHPKDITG